MGRERTAAGQIAAARLYAYGVAQSGPTLRKNATQRNESSLPAFLAPASALTTKIDGLGLAAEVATRAIEGGKAKIVCTQRTSCRRGCQPTGHGKANKRARSMNKLLPVATGQFHHAITDSFFATTSSRQTGIAFGASMPRRICPPLTSMTVTVILSSITRRSPILRDKMSMTGPP